MWRWGFAGSINLGDIGQWSEFPTLTFKHIADFLTFWCYLNEEKSFKIQKNGQFGAVSWLKHPPPPLRYMHSSTCNPWPVDSGWSQGWSVGKGGVGYKLRLAHRRSTLGDAIIHLVTPNSTPIDTALGGPCQANHVIRRTVASAWVPAGNSHHIDLERYGTSEYNMGVWHKVHHGSVYFNQNYRKDTQQTMCPFFENLRFFAE